MASVLRGDFFLAAAAHLICGHRKHSSDGLPKGGKVTEAQLLTFGGRLRCHVELEEALQVVVLATGITTQLRPFGLLYIAAWISTETGSAAM